MIALHAFGYSGRADVLSGAGGELVLSEVEVSASEASVPTALQPVLPSLHSLLAVAPIVISALATLRWERLIAVHNSPPSNSATFAD